MESVDPIASLRWAQRVILDTNMLVLWVTGNASPGLISRLSNTGGNRDNQEKFNLLCDAIQKLPGGCRFLITPHIAAETWNHLENCFKQDQVARSAIANAFAQYASVSLEKSRALRVLVEENDFPRLGVSDMAQLALARRGTVVFTTDAQLVDALEKKRCQVLNINWVQFPA